MAGFSYGSEIRNGVKVDDKRWIVILNEYEMHLVEVIARDKLRVEEMRGIVHRVSDFEKRRDGFAAELAFCKLFNVYRDFGMQYSGYDVTIEGKTVDVKQTSYDDGKIMVSVGTNPCDLYALMVGQGRTFVFRGFIAGNDLCKLMRRQTFNGKEFYVAPQNELVKEVP